MIFSEFMYFPRILVSLLFLTEFLKNCELLQSILMMEDERWTTKDKIDQFRGVTALYSEYNKLTIIFVEKSNMNVFCSWRKEQQVILKGGKTSIVKETYTNTVVEIIFHGLRCVLNYRELSKMNYQSVWFVTYLITINVSFI